MSQSLQGCRHIPGWVKPYLQAIRNGYNEKNAANMAGEGTAVIRRHLEKDELFKKQLEEAQANAKPRFGHGAY